MQIEKWLPTPVSTYRTLLNFSASYSLKSNIIYNLQYMEYTLHIIKENNSELTSNLFSMLCKHYLITFISITIKNKTGR